MAEEEEDNGCVLHRMGKFKYLGLIEVFIVILITGILDVEALPSQTGFISIDAGYLDGPYYSSTTKELWVADAFFSTGETGQISHSPQEQIVAETTLRYFPNGTKNCYKVPVARPGRFLVRLSFWYYNYDQLTLPPIFNVSVGSTQCGQVKMDPSSVKYPEYVVSHDSTTLPICFIRVTGNPIINGIEVRPLPPSSYSQQEVGHDVMLLWWRLTCGGNASVSTYRYPQDPLDRIWYADEIIYATADSNGGLPYLIEPIAINLTRTNRSISRINSPPNYPPQFIFQKSRSTDSANASLNYTFYSFLGPPMYKIYFYFAELHSPVSVGSRVFDVLINGKVKLRDVDVYKEAGNRSFTAVTRALTYDQAEDQTTTLVLQFRPKNGTLLPNPIVSAFEIYQVFAAAVPTQSQETEALLDFLDKVGNPVVLQDCFLNDTGIEGTISPFLGNLTNLQLLNLANNLLVGNISVAADALKNIQLTVSGNDGLCSSAGLLGLPVCGLFPPPPPPLPPAASPPPPSPPVTLPPGSGPFQSPSGPQPPRPSSSSSNAAVIAGAVVAVAVVVGAVVLLALCLLRVKKRPQGISAVMGAASPDGAAASPKPPDEAKAPLVSGYKQLSGVHKARHFSLEEMSTATGNFSDANRIASGGFGTVYKGKLLDGTEVAIKKRSKDSLQGEKEFYNEVELLSRVHHRHLVSLLGFCHDQEQQILVYEFMANGTVRDHLYDVAGVQLGRLPWQQRLSIAIGAARGIEYLHTGSNPTIIHRDIKTSNILLDANFVPKVADFGLSKLGPDGGQSHVSTMVKGTAGYLDPEYYTVQQLTDKSDVYSFGVVLLELICARQPVNLTRQRNEWSLVEWARAHLQEGNLAAIIDATLSTADYLDEVMWRVAELGMLCVEPAGDNRPSISEVLRELREVLEIEQGTANVAHILSVASHQEEGQEVMI
eukprot:jgi/Mesen1/7467/ME000039S06688